MAIKNGDSKHVYAYASGLLLFLAPLLRASFFEKELLLIIIYTLTIFAFFFYRDYITKPLQCNVNLLEGSSIALLLIYIATFFIAFNLRGSFITVLTLGTYLALYFVVSRSIKEIKDYRVLFKGIYLGGMTVSFVGLGTAFGSFAIEGAYQEGRITSTLQYANSLAVFLTVVLILGFYLVLTERKLISRLMFAGGNFLGFVVLLGTQSRGAWLIYPLIIGLFVIGQQKGLRLKALGVVAGTTTATLIVVSRVLNTGNLKNPAWEQWAFLFAGFIIAVGLQYVLEKLPVGGAESGVKSPRRNVVVALVGIVICGAIIIAAVQFMPKELLSRIASISLSTRNVTERIYFYKDALKIIADYPVLGTGGEGWASIYKHYQSYFYLTKQVHNQFLQVAVETGVLGFLAYLGIWLGFGRQAWRSWRNNPSGSSERAIIWVAVCAVLALGLHSLIDFTLALPAVSFILWVLFGIVRGLNGEPATSAAKGFHTKEHSSVEQTWAKGIVAVILIVCIAAAMSFRLAGSYAEKGVAAIQSDDYKTAVLNYERAAKFDPYKDTYVATLAQIYYKVGVGARKQAYFVKSLDMADRAVRLNRGEAFYYKVRSSANMALDKIALGVKDAEVAREMSPWETSYYEHLGRVYLVAGNELKKAGKTQEAKAYYNKAAHIPENIKNQLKKLTPETKTLWIRGEKLSYTKKIVEYALEGARLMSK